jgi:FtsH-binding integral membrane protein
VTAQRSNQNRHKKTRPLSVTLLALGVLSIALVNLAGFVQAFFTWDFLEKLLSFSPAWIGISRLFWGVWGIFVAWNLWYGRKAAPKLILWTSISFLLFTWINRLVLYTSAGRSANFGCLSVISIILIVFMIWAITSPEAKSFFGVINEQPTG